MRINKKFVNKMIDFSKQEKKAEGESKDYTHKLSKRIHQRITRLERIEKSRYIKLRVAAKNRKMTISKLLDEVIDAYINSYEK